MFVTYLWERSIKQLTVHTWLIRLDWLSITQIPECTHCYSCFMQLFYCWRYFSWWECITLFGWEWLVSTPEPTPKSCHPSHKWLSEALTFPTAAFLPYSPVKAEIFECLFCFSLLFSRWEFDQCSITGSFGVVMWLFYWLWSFITLSVMTA